MFRNKNNKKEKEIFGIVYLMIVNHTDVYQVNESRLKQFYFRSCARMYVRTYICMYIRAYVRRFSLQTNEIKYEKQKVNNTSLLYDMCIKQFQVLRVITLGLKTFSTGGGPSGFFLYHLSSMVLNAVFNIQCMNFVGKQTVNGVFSGT